MHVKRNDLNAKSRMKGDFHVRFRERLRVKFPWSTRQRYNRYISLSRRNSLFFGSHKGAERGALFYSLACSCRMQGINTFEYITEVINKAAKLPPNTDIKVYRNLLPDKWKENRSRIET